jgi:sterol desaturase/sphingolipid hydroxylase (fatty acid hydroxylase superfamily)
MLARTAHQGAAVKTVAQAVRARQASGTAAALVPLPSTRQAAAVVVVLVAQVLLELTHQRLEMAVRERPRLSQARPRRAHMSQALTHSQVVAAVAALAAALARLPMAAAQGQQARPARTAQQTRAAAAVAAVVVRDLAATVARES